MIFDKLINCIPGLLFKHNCVIIPGFGGFITNFEQAGFEESRNIISPARRKVAFNQSLKDNDGLLVNHWSHVQNISYQDSLADIESFVNFLKDKLASDKSYDFQNIGTIYLNNENNLIFVPHEGINFMESSFGLFPVKIKQLAGASKVLEVKRHAEIRNSQFEFDTQSKIKERRELHLNSRHHNKIFYKVASIVLIITVAGAGTFFLFNKNFNGFAGRDNSKQNASILNTGSYNKNENVTKQEHTSKRVYDSERIKLREIKSRLSQFSKANESEQETYNVIVGYFDTEAKAKSVQISLAKDFVNTHLNKSAETGYYIIVETFFKHTTAESFSVMLRQNGYWNTKVEKVMITQ